MKEFTNKYPSQKTLRFELQPQGKTRDYIDKNGILLRDKERNESYQEMKKTIDRFHKYFIDLALSDVKLSHLSQFKDLYLSVEMSEQQKKTIDEVKTKLRKEVAAAFRTGDAKSIFSLLDKKELITKLLKEWAEKERINNFYFDENFEKFTTYFKGFHQNRQNMYSDEAKATSIAYRSIHENLPRFIDNILIFQKLLQKEEIASHLHDICIGLEGYLNVNSIPEMFEINYYNTVLTQRQIEVYNAVIGGKTFEDGVQIQGVNQYINLYNQRCDHKDRVPPLKQLYKQILSDRESLSFLPDAFEEASQVFKSINQFFENNLIQFKVNDLEPVNILENVSKLMTELAFYDLNHIYVNNTFLSDISQKIFRNYAVIKEALNYQYESKIDPFFSEKYAKAKAENSREKLEKAKKNYTEKSYISLYEIQIALNNYMLTLEEDCIEKKSFTQTCLIDYYRSVFTHNTTEGEIDIITSIYRSYEELKEISSIDYPKNTPLSQDKSSIAKIKSLLDNVMELFHCIKPFAVPEEEISDKDGHFYNNFLVYYKSIKEIIPLRHKVQSYVTQKPYSLKKFKVNFDNSYFLTTWPFSYENKGGVIIRKEDLFYLAIINCSVKDLANYKLNDCSIANSAERIIIDTQKPDNKNIPRLFIRSKGDSFAPAVTEYDLPINDIIDIYDNGKFKTEHKKLDPEEFKSSLTALIDYFKLGLSRHNSYKHYKYQWKPSDCYNDISEFYNDTVNSCYQIKTEKINFDKILELVSEGKVYLFKIYNKDFSPNSKGQPNLHTMYWRALFDENNLKNVIYKLNGGAEIFFREKSISKENEIVHYANQPIKNKNPHAIKREVILPYDVIKDKRFCIDKFQLHIPITLNFKATGKEQLNSDVLQYLKDTPQNQVKVIGIDRGERHLLYLTMIDHEGHIIMQESLNTVKSDNYPIKTQYHDLLAQKEEDRNKARSNWDSIENIKELKEGYLSQVVHKLAKLIVENNAVLVMEDLNIGFKRGRFKVEKQVYQKFEKALIDKLNYLVFKDKKVEEEGGLFKALQLTEPYTDFLKYKKKQCGFLFYVQAWNTSKIDPTTGFIDMLKPKYKNIPEAQEFFRKFISIKYNSDKDYFEFYFDYRNFPRSIDSHKNDWTVCTYGKERYVWNRSLNQGKGDYEIWNVTEKIKELFNIEGIEYRSGCNLTDAIANSESKSLLSMLMKSLSVVLAMRYSSSKDNRDFILSPVANDKGVFYYSEEADQYLPKDADANGAYNIARKGLLLLDRIRSSADLKSLKLDIANKEWLMHAQK